MGCDDIRFVDVLRLFSVCVVGIYGVASEQENAAFIGMLAISLIFIGYEVMESKMKSKENQ